MTNLIDSVGELTDLRDKDELEITLATVTFELIDASTLFLWRLVRSHGDVWLRRHVSLAAEPFDALATSKDLLPLNSHEELRACYDSKLYLRRPLSEPGVWRHIFPVTDGRDVIGFLEIIRSSPLQEDQERLIFGMLRIYRNHLGILDYSDCDDLTGLLNRRTFDESFRRIALPERASRAATRGLSPDRRRHIRCEPRAHIAVADIDFFKRVNDQFGHPYGDEVLVLVSRLMSNCFRDTDRLFRFGGEEFVVILTDTGEREAEEALERFRATVEVFQFPQVGRITVSIGYTSVLVGDTGSNAFGRADEALYVAKHNGRNQIRSYETLVADGLLEAKKIAGQEVELF